MLLRFCVGTTKTKIAVLASTTPPKCWALGRSSTCWGLDLADVWSDACIKLWLHAYLLVRVNFFRSKPIGRTVAAPRTQRGIIFFLTCYYLHTFRTVTCLGGLCIVWRSWVLKNKGNALAMSMSRGFGLMTADDGTSLREEIHTSSHIFFCP